MHQKTRKTQQTMFSTFLWCKWYKILSLNLRLETSSFWCWRLTKNVK